MKKIFFMCVLVLLLTGCSQSNPDMGPKEESEIQLNRWEIERKNHEREVLTPVVVRTQLVESDPVGELVASYLSGALAFYPDFGEGAQTLEELPEEFYRMTGLYGARGIFVGEGSASQEIYVELNKQLGYPNQFIAKEQVMQVLYHYFDYSGELPNATTPLLPEAASYRYVEEYSIYLYPEEPDTPWAVLVMDLHDKGGEYGCFAVLVKSLDHEGLSYRSAEGLAMTPREIVEDVEAQGHLYDWYTITLTKTPEGGVFLRQIELLG